MWDRQQHSLSRNNRKYFAEYLTWQTFCQCPALFTNGSDMWKVVSTLVLFFSPIYVYWIIMCLVLVCAYQHIFLHVCRNLEFVVMVFRACLWPRSTLWRGGASAFAGFFRLPASTGALASSLRGAADAAELFSSNDLPCRGSGWSLHQQQWQLRSTIELSKMCGEEELRTYGGRTNARGP